MRIFCLNLQWFSVETFLLTSYFTSFIWSTLILLNWSGSTHTIMRPLHLTLKGWLIWRSLFSWANHLSLLINWWEHYLLQGLFFLLFSVGHFVSLSIFYCSFNYACSISPLQLSGHYINSLLIRTACKTDGWV